MGLVNRPKVAANLPPPARNLQAYVSKRGVFWTWSAVRRLDRSSYAAVLQTYLQYVGRYVRLRRLDLRLAAAFQFPLSWWVRGREGNKRLPAEMLEIHRQISHQQLELSDASDLLAKRAPPDIDTRWQNCAEKSIIA